MATEDKIDKVLLEHLGSGGVSLCPVLLDLPTVPDWADGTDQQGRSVLLIGKSFLGESEEAQETVKLVLEDLGSGSCPDLAHAVAYAPIASKAIAAIVEGPEEEFLLHGERGTGKTVIKAGISPILAELHLRAGYLVPFKVIWLHDSLLSASIKTARTLENAMWGGLWTIHDDSRQARFSIAGRALVHVDFVGCKDESSAERLRASAHLVKAEELIASQTDGTGISEQQYELALSSMRRQDVATPRRRSVCATNPGAPESWPAQRWGIVGTARPKTRAIRIPREDRMTAEEQAEQDTQFANSPTLHRRLVKGEWVMADLGEAVAEGFDERFHVAPSPLTPRSQFLLGIGWDGGHTPSAVIGQYVGGQVRVFASLNEMRAGVRELIKAQVLPWLQQHAPWSLENYGASIVNIIDPNMATPGQVTILESAARTIEEELGGRIIKGPVRWAPRREAVLQALSARHGKGKAQLQINPGPDTALLVQAFNGRWFYKKLDNGQVDRTGPKKPCSPHADIGDAAAYLLDWLYGGELMTTAPREVTVETQFNPLRH